MNKLQDWYDSYTGHWSKQEEYSHDTILHKAVNVPEKLATFLTSFISNINKATTLWFSSYESLKFYLCYIPVLRRAEASWQFPWKWHPATTNRFEFVRTPVNEFNLAIHYTQPSAIISFSFFLGMDSYKLESIPELYAILLEEHIQISLEMQEVGICSLLKSPKLTRLIQYVQMWRLCWLKFSFMLFKPWQFQMY
jgi:hypothetical protein